MLVSAESNLMFSSQSVSFSLPLRRWKKSSLHRRSKSETQQDHLTVKTTEKRSKYLCYLLNLESFFSRYQCRHAFLQERSQKYFQNELLESIRQTISLACSVLIGRAQKDVFEAAVFERKKRVKR